MIRGSSAHGPCLPTACRGPSSTAAFWRHPPRGFIARILLSAQSREPFPKGRWAWSSAVNIDGGMHEDIDITNYGPKLVTFSLELMIRSDFADLFEVKSKSVTRCGAISTEWDRSQMVPAAVLRLDAKAEERRGWQKNSGVESGLGWRRDKGG